MRIKISERQREKLNTFFFEMVMDTEDVPDELEEDLANEIYNQTAHIDELILDV